MRKKIGTVVETNVAMPIRGGKTAQIGMATEINTAASLNVTVRTRLLLHWAQIAVKQEEEAHKGRAELKSRHSASPGVGLDLSMELHPSMLSAAAAASTIDALYGEVREDAGVPEELREVWREKRTPRYSQIYETLSRGFRVKTDWHAELKWLFREQRDAALHAESGYGSPQLHPLGVNVAREYVIYRCEHARRAVDLMLDMLTTCASAPRPALEQWAREAEKPIADLVTSRRGDASAATSDTR